MPSVEQIAEALFGADCFVRVSSTLTELYADMGGRYWGLLCDVIGEPVPDTAPSVVVAHSLHTRPQTVRIKAMSYVLFDQHLGQVFSQMTRLGSTRADPLIVRAYLGRLLAQRAYVIGNFSDAASLGLLARGYVSKAQQGNAEVVEDQGTYSLRLMLATYQEQFALAHELAHAALRLQADRGHEPFLTEAPDIVQRIVENIEASEESNSNSDPLHLEYISKFRTLSRSPHLIEELRCDYLAAMCVRAMLDRDTDGALALASTCLALSHLGVLQLADMFVGHRNGDLIMEGVCETLLRQRFLQRVVKQDLANSQSHAPQDPTIASPERFAEAADILLDSSISFSAISHFAEAISTLDLIESDGGADVSKVRDLLVSQPNELKEWLRLPLSSGVGDRSLLYTAEQRERFDEGLRNLHRVRAEASEADSSTG